MKALLKRLLQRAGYLMIRRDGAAARYVERPPRSVFQSLLFRLFTTLDGLQFIQVGANDGRREDPLVEFITRHGWTGVLLEPVPSLYRHLRQLHAGNPRLTLLNAALDHRVGTRPIYRLRDDAPASVPDWAWGLASFDRDRVAGALAALQLPATALVEETVDTITWDDAWRRLPGGRCDLLVLDTEGYDVTLLRRANLAERRPALVHFEHGCTGPDIRWAFYRELAALGYEIATEGQDTTAWLPRK